MKIWCVFVRRRATTWLVIMNYIGYNILLKSTRLLFTANLRAAENIKQKSCPSIMRTELGLISDNVILYMCRSEFTAFVYLQNLQYDRQTDM